MSGRVLAHGATQALYRDPATGTFIIAVDTSVYRSTDNGVTWTDIGTSGLPFAYYEAVLCDGTTMWTAPSFPLQGDNNNSYTAWLTKSLTAAAGTAWTSFGVQTDRLDPSGYYNGPVMGAYDAFNHVLYGVCWNGGFWRMTGQRDLVRSELQPAASAYTVRLGTINTPGTGTQTLTYSYAKNSPSGQMNMTVELMQGGSVLQTWSHTNIPDIFTVATQTITAIITDYTTPFDIRFTATQVA